MQAAVALSGVHRSTAPGRRVDVPPTLGVLGAFSRLSPEGGSVGRMSSLQIYDAICREVIFDGEILTNASVLVPGCPDQNGRATITVEDCFGGQQTYPGLGGASNVEVIHGLCRRDHRSRQARTARGSHSSCAAA